MPFPVVSFMKRELIITLFNALLFYLIFNILPNFHKKMSSGEDDYMSSDLLNKISDVKPGVSSSRNAQRMLRINQNAEKQRSERAPTKEQAEKTKLEEGIQKPIGSDTKGFKLLSMMGYKPGMSLGRARESQPEGIKEPIQMQMKTGRTGLGLDEENRLKQKQICEAHMAQMKHRARMEESLADDYRSRRRFLASQKEIISDIRRMQRACQELDIRNGKEMPEDFWFWPIYSSRSDPETGKLLAAVEQADDDDDADEDGPTGLKRRRIADEKIAEDVQQEVHYHYSTGKTAPMNLNLYELDEQQLNQNLEQMVAYMRDNHFYCIWCGCSYEDQEDLSTNCPGTTRSEHEE